MAEAKTNQEKEPLSREYVIPLRRSWLRVPEYKRSRKAVQTIKLFIAKHFKVENRDIDKVKLDVYLNNDIWFKGRTGPPSKVKVKATRDGENVLVTFAQIPDYVKFVKQKNEKFHKPSEKPKDSTKDSKTQDKKDEQTKEEKIDEHEKGKAVEEQNIKLAEQAAKTSKHLTKGPEQHIHRKALKK